MIVFFRRLFQRIQSSVFLKSVLTLSSGVVVGQAINFLGMPVVGRIYTPAAMGDYTLITANSAIISAFVCLGMMTSFMLPKENEEARGLSKLVTASTVLLTTLVIGILGLVTGVGNFILWLADLITVITQDKITLFAD